METISKNQIFEAEITGYTSEGQGVCRIEGRAVFVSGALQGEHCRVRIVKVTASAVFGKLEEVLVPSPERRDPGCPVYGKCGGCGLLHMSYEEELRFKLDRVNSALRRIGGLDFTVPEILSAPSREGYRNKVIYNAAPGPALGFYRRRSHEVIPIERCPVQPESSERALRAVRDWMTECAVPAYDESRGKGCLRHVFTRLGFATGQLQVVLVTAAPLKDSQEEKLVSTLRKHCPELRSLVLCLNKSRGNTVLSGHLRTIWGEDAITDRLCSLQFSLSPFSFYQINPAQAERLYDLALAYAAPEGAGTVLDLYCGTGTISLCLARGAERVIGAEIVADAVEDARRNAVRNRIPNAEFICADAGEAAAQLYARGIRPDAVVVDPPRKGLSPEVIETVANMMPERVVYVSCDPGTLARDLNRFAEKGYTLHSATAVDMFPATAHVETVVLLCKKGQAMIIDEKSKYKSWSNLKKQMNDLLCDSLKKSIAYFYTNYHEVHNVYGRATINYSKKELVAFSWVEMYEQDQDINRLWHEGEKKSYSEMLREKWMPECTLCDANFIDSVTVFLKTDIAASLQSDNYLLRIFAYMDRRVGKRTLAKIRNEVEKLPEWVKQFYQIRCEAEGLCFQQNRTIDETVVLMSRKDT